MSEAERDLERIARLAVRDILLAIGNIHAYNRPFRVGWPKEVIVSNGDVFKTFDFALLAAEQGWYETDAAWLKAELKKGPFFKTNP